MIADLVLLLMLLLLLLRLLRWWRGLPKLWYLMLLELSRL